MLFNWTDASFITVINVEFSLLLVELILLVVTVVLLTLHLKEERGRRDLINEVSRATKVLTRQEYFNEVINGFHDAKKSIFGCITASRPMSVEEEKTVELIVKHLRELAKDGVKMRFLAPKFTDRLHIGYRYRQVGAEVFYNNCALVNDMRYMVVDGRFVLIGIPEKVGESEPTKKGYRIPSIGIAAIIKEHFEPCINGRITSTYEEYVKEILEEMKKIRTELDFEPVSRELQIPVEELKRIDALDITPKPSLKLDL